MCGVTGIFDCRGRRAVSRELLVRMNDSQFHRGPDQGGVHLEPGVGLGHRRLSIIDLSGGTQPLFNEDSSVVVVFNGEIYNFQGLAEELKTAGHRFRTHSDTEVIVHAWEEWGAACVERFRGMFVFAIWDRNRETLFLARDRLGKKPLYYAHLPDGHLIFASELKALYLHPGLPREIDPCAVEEYFGYGYVPEPRTILKAAFKLPPGHHLTLKRGARVPAEPKEYWDVPFGAAPKGSEEDLQVELVERLREAVRIRLIAEVPLGAFLSGGVDSSAVVAMMAGLSEGPVNTCSISFGDPKFNESGFAEQVARRYGTNHRVEQVDPDDFALVDRLPISTTSPMPTAPPYLPTGCASWRAARSRWPSPGDGGDENLAGYRRYRWHTYEERLRSALPLALRRPLFGTLGTRLPQARLGAAGAARQVDLPGPGPRHGGGVLPRRLGARRRDARAALQRALPPRAARLSGGRCPAPPRRASPHRSSAVSGSVSGHEDLSGRGHPDQGGPRQHGPRPGGAGAASGPRAGGVDVVAPA